jgi:hypothetical protein
MLKLTGFLSGLFCGVTICCIIPAILLYFPGYKAREIENANLLETTCYITKHKVYQRTCSESCNCYSYCSSYGSNGACSSYSTRCQTCKYFLKNSPFIFS